KPKASPRFGPAGLAGCWATAQTLSRTSLVLLWFFFIIATASGGMWQPAWLATAKLTTLPSASEKLRKSWQISLGGFFLLIPAWSTLARFPASARMGRNCCMHGGMPAEGPGPMAGPPIGPGPVGPAAGPTIIPELPGGGAC